MPRKVIWNTPYWSGSWKSTELLEGTWLVLYLTGCPGAATLIYGKITQTYSVSKSPVNPALTPLFLKLCVRFPQDLCVSSQSYFQGGWYASVKKMNNSPVAHPFTNLKWFWIVQNSVHSSKAKDFSYWGLDCSSTRKTLVFRVVLK